MKPNKSISNIVIEQVIKHRLFSNGCVCKSADILTLLKNLSINTDKVFISDNTYFTFDDKNFLNRYDKKAFAAWRKVVPWTVFNDCDDFALQFKAYFNGAFSKYCMQNKSDAESVGVGIVWYKANSTDGTNKTYGHAVNFILKHDENDLLYISFFEPQTQKFIYLTEDEIKSIFFIYI